MLKQQPKFVDESFKWDVGKIDTILQKERYSPVYRCDVGILRGKLVNKEEFDLLWDHYYEISEEKVAKVSPSQDNASRCKLFDWLAYLALVKHTFGELDLEKIKEYDPKILK